MAAAWLAMASESCVGPAAPDAAVCRDVVHRLCLSPRCPSVEEQLSVGDECEDVLLGRTGCGDDSFTFETIARDRVLECRLFLLRGAPGSDDRPQCLFVDDLFTACEDLTLFLKGSPP